ncbi:MAG TPA: hypothetical protein VG963_03675 [Polyangiaceae bacterium]|nr:hypothetical protein [Polyangiaceae bacterium]
MKSVADGRARVESEFRSIVGWVEGNDCKTAAAFEGELWRRVLGLGAALFALFLCCRAERLQAERYEHGGRSFVMTKSGRSGVIGTMFGKVAFWQPMAQQVGKNRSDLPLARELHIGAAFTLGVISSLAELCARMPFAQARSVFRKFCGWAPSPKVVLRVVDALGDQARPFIDQLPAPAGDGEFLVLEVDGRGAPMISPAEYARRTGPRVRWRGTDRDAVRTKRRERPKVRRAKGKKSKNAKVAVVGVLYTLKRTRNGVEGPLNKRVLGTFESHEALFRWLLPEARKRGYGQKQTIFIADGSDHIWRLQQRYFPDAIPCIDFWHIAEKLWEAGTLLLKEGTAELRGWYDEHKALLRHGKISTVIDHLGDQIAHVPRTGPRNKWRRKRLLEIQKHLAEHSSRMRYERLRRDGLVIGSGAVEGAVRNIVGIRLDGPGMRWGRERSERVLRLRCVLVNGQWDLFHAYLDQTPIKLRAQPMPTVPHQAKTAA